MGIACNAGKLLVVEVNPVLLDSLRGIWKTQGFLEKGFAESRMIAHDDSVIADLVDIKSIDCVVGSPPLLQCFSSRDGHPSRDRSI